MGIETSSAAADRGTVLVPSGWKVATHPDRSVCSFVDLGATVLTSGTVRVSSFALPAGVSYSKVGLVSGATALSAGSNQWGVLLDSAFTVLAVSADGTSGAWAANTLKTFTFGAAYKTLKPGTYWAGVMVNATVPSLQGTLDSNSVIPLLSPVVTGSSSTGQTTPPALGAILTSPGGAAAAVLKPYVLLG